MNSRGCRNQRGSTLVESLIAISLFALGAASISNLLVTNVRIQGLNLAKTTSIALAERELEDLRTLDYPDIASRSSTQTVGGAQYTLTTTVTADVPAANMKTIKVVVSWPGLIGAQTYEINAIYTDIKR